MKSLDMKVELVREYAKELTYSGELAVRSHQGQVLWEQARRQSILKGQVDYIITDSPLWVSAVYGRDKWQERWFLETVLDTFREYENFNVVIDRAKPFQAYGRTETEDEARNVDGMMLGFMDSANIPVHLRIPGTPKHPNSSSTKSERHAKMFNRFLNRAILLILPDVETILAGIARSLQTLDRVTNQVEAVLTDNAVRLAEDARRRREALEAVNRTFDRRNEQTLSLVENTRAKLERAGAARDAVSDLLDRLN
jgi:hypothetical protein